MAELESFHGIVLFIAALCGLAIAYHYVLKLPTGLPRLLFVLPLLPIFFLLPWTIPIYHLRAILSFIFLWTVPSKLLLLCWDAGIDYPDSGFLYFITINMLPIRVKGKKQKQASMEEKQGAHLSPFCWQFIAVIVILNIYSYRNGLPLSLIYVLYAFHMYLGLELMLGGLAKAASMFFGVESDPQFNNPFMSASLSEFWGRRWNLVVTTILRSTVYNPALRLLTRAEKHKVKHQVSNASSSRTGSICDGCCDLKFSQDDQACSKLKPQHQSSHNCTSNHHSKCTACYEINGGLNCKGDVPNGLVACTNNHHSTCTACHEINGRLNGDVPNANHSYPNHKVNNTNDPRDNECSKPDSTQEHEASNPEPEDGSEVCSSPNPCDGTNRQQPSHGNNTWKECSSIDPSTTDSSSCSKGDNDAAPSHPDAIQQACSTPVSGHTCKPCCTCPVTDASHSQNSCHQLSSSHSCHCCHGSTPDNDNRQKAGLDCTYADAEKPSLWARALAMIATFVVSGLIHELIFYYINQSRATGEVTAFFILHGLATAVEVFVRRTVPSLVRLPRAISIAFTMTFLYLTSAWLFMPPLTRTGADINTIAEYQRLQSAIIAFFRS